MQKLLTLIIFLFCCSLNTYAQMWNAQDTLYGNEWINYDQTYYKIQLAEDGIYRIPTDVLAAEGVPVSSIQSEEFQLYHMGQEVPVYISTNNTLGADDFIEFYGEKNRTELDSFLYTYPLQKMTNLHYSLFTDTSAYFLTWNNDPNNERFEWDATMDISDAPPKEDYFMHDEFKNFAATFIKKVEPGNVYRSQFMVGEGYTRNFPETNTQGVNIKPVYIYNTGGDAKATVRLIGSEGQHELTIDVEDVEYLKDNFAGYLVKQYEFDIPVSELEATTNFVFTGNVDGNDKYAVSHVSLIHPRQFNFDNNQYFEFEIEGGNTTKYLEIAAFDTGGGDAILYDITNKLRLSTVYEDGLVKVVLPPSATKRKLILFNTVSGIKTITTVESKDFIDYFNNEGEYLILTSKKLLKDPVTGNNYVQDYANYRSSIQGGGYSTIIVDVQQIFDQFAYGINRHNIAIRNFGYFVKKNWTDPKFFFIIGKAREYIDLRLPGALGTPDNESYAVPTFGWPGSDNLLLSTNTSNTPIISIGRIAVSNWGEIKTYLDKVKVYENTDVLGQTVDEKEWMKKVVHLGGGDPNIQSTIRNHLSVMEDTLTNNKFGAEVTSFYKTSADPIQISQSEQIFNAINNGLSMLTFFGHSAVGTFDFTIDEPENYENKGKYPLMISLGCYSGNIHTPIRGISERFVFAEEKGAIGFFASTGAGQVTPLNLWARDFYARLGGENYGEPMGDIFKESIRLIDGYIGTGFKTLAQQFTLHGDPALVINSHAGPDYLIDNGSVAFDPPLVTLQQDSFDFNFTVSNIGSGLSDSFLVEVVQELPNNETAVVVSDRIAAPKFNTELSYRIPVFGAQSLGENKFYITIDADQEIDELPNPAAENNNTLVNSQGNQGISLFIIHNNAQPIYPHEFNIVHAEEVVLKASTTNALAPLQNYIMEIDTTELFNSPLKQRTEIMQEGGVLEWIPNQNFVDGTVYYWRTSIDSTSQVGYSWNNSSFLYLPSGSNGWNQSHYYQFKKDRYVNMELPEDTRQFKYLDDFKDINIRNIATENIVQDFSKMSLNNEVLERHWGFQPYAGMYIVVLDSVSVEPWLNPYPGGTYGDVPHPAWVGTIRAFPFATTEQADRASIINFLENEVPPNNYVAIFTVQRFFSDYQPEEWAADSIALGTNIFQVLESQGANQVRGLETTGAVPYVFIYQKDQGALGEGIAALVTDEVTVNTSIQGAWDRGYVESTIIGPANQWTSLEWEHTKDHATDFASVDIIGLEDNGGEVVLHENLLAPDTSLVDIPAGQYRYLKLRFNSKDSLFRTSPQLDFWRVNYVGFRELAVNKTRFLNLPDTIAQGQLFNMGIAVENTGDYNADSVLVKFMLKDIANNENTIYKRLSPLSIGDTLIADLNLETQDMKGTYQIVFEANPNEDQTEMYHFNNFAIGEFYVAEDQLNPVLDVTFDGVHIMDGDIVSAKPNIVITLEDENEYLALGDTSLFKVLLKYPNETTVRPLFFDSGLMNFYPASNASNKNKASIELNPTFLEDGLYQLVIQAEDVTGNESGQLDYKINFKIITKAMISNVMNYPNPFSTSTQFAYTLTGDSAPEFFKIQIMTVAGRIVKEITQDEMGPLRVGTHLTDYTWDGMDDYGNKLANGVYLYRIVTKDTFGKDIEDYENNTDQFFKKGFGKMVILR